MAKDYPDSPWTDNVAWWKDKDGNSHEGMWDRSERSEVRGLIIELPEDVVKSKREDPEDKYAEFSGKYFSDYYTLDDFWETEVEDNEHYIG